LEIRPDAKITPMIIKNLVSVITDEFNRQRTIYNATAEKKKEEIMVQYRKGVGFDKLKKEYDKAELAKKKAVEEMNNIEKTLKMKGLNVNGDKNNGYYGGYNTTEELEYEKAEKKLNKLLRAVEDSGPDNIKNKIISRLWICTTVGEAMVILRQVLGNGIIPSLTVKQLTQEV